MHVGMITVDGREIGEVNFTVGSMPIAEAPMNAPGADDYPGGLHGHWHGQSYQALRHGPGHHGSHSSHHEPAHGHERTHKPHGGHEGHHKIEEPWETPFPKEVEAHSYGTPNGTLREQRKRLGAEMDANPELKNKIMRIMANEQGTHPEGTQSVAESMMNRALVRGTSLEKAARWFRREPGGYYEMGNMGRGALENPAHRAILEQGLTNALKGGNVSNYATDNSSGSLAARERASGAFRFRQGYHGETFFAPGSAEKGLASKWDQWHEGVTKAEEHGGGGAHLKDAAKRSGRSITFGPLEQHHGPQSSIAAPYKVATAKDHVDTGPTSFNDRWPETELSAPRTPEEQKEHKMIIEMLQEQGVDFKTPSGIYPPTPGDASDPAKTRKHDPFSIPSDYNQG